MPNDLERPLRRTTSLCLVLDALEDRRLLSGAGGQDDSPDDPPAAPAAWVASPQHDDVATSLSSRDPEPASPVAAAPEAGGTSSDASETPTSATSAEATPAGTAEDVVPVNIAAGSSTSPASAVTTSAGSTDEAETSLDVVNTPQQGSGSQAPVAAGTTAASSDDEADPEPSGAAVAPSSARPAAPMTAVAPGNGPTITPVTAARIPTQTDSEAEPDEALSAVPAGHEPTPLSPAKAETVVGPTVAVSGSPGGRGSEATREDDPAAARWERGTALMASQGAAAGGFSGEEVSPAARAADLVAGFSPFDRATLERAIDQFLDRLGEFESGLAPWGSGENLVPNLLTAAVMVSAAELARRRLRDPEHDEDTEADGRTATCPLGVPGLPLGWGLEE